MCVCVCVRVKIRQRNKNKIEISENVSGYIITQSPFGMTSAGAVAISGIGAADAATKTHHASLPQHHYHRHRQLQPVMCH